MNTKAVTTASALGALALVSLAGCAASTTGSAGDHGSAGSSGAVSPASLKDGDYTATGHYTSPGGDSAVAVDLTLKGGTVTKLTVTPKAENPTARSYESKFASGVDDLVVGKKLTDVEVTTVSGSSLTSKGFDAAVARIEKDAAA